MRFTIIMLAALAAAGTRTAQALPVAVAPYSPDADTVLLYHLDEAAGATFASDETGSFHLFSNASPFAGKSGPAGLTTAGGAFDTSDKFLRQDNLSQPEADLFNPQTFTIEGWVRNIDFANAPPGLLQLRDGSNSRISLRFDSQRISLGIQRDNDGGFQSLATSPLTWEDDVWYHVAVTYDGDGTGDDSVVRFYRTPEGDTSGAANLITSLTGAPDIRPLTAGVDIHLGANDGSSNRLFGGDADEVRFMNRVIAADEFNLSSVIPEPASNWLVLTGVAVLHRRRQRRRE